jgi:hypothetical protein
VSSAASTSTSGNVNIGADSQSNLWLFGIAGLVIVLIVWLANRKA